MHFLALLLGLTLERVLTHLFHWREFRWLDPLLEAHIRRYRGQTGALPMVLTLVLTLLLVAPVALLSRLLWDELLQVPYFAFAVLVLLFSLGPRDLDDEVEEYTDALEAGNLDTQQRLAAVLLEGTPPAAPAERHPAVERAIYVQANNRVFGVVFWFLVLGPTGAWTFRILDLLRHRAIRNGPLAAASLLHGLWAWIPSRLLALSYVLAGNFEEAMATWRNPGHEAALPLSAATEAIIARVGIAAAGRSTLNVADEQEALDRLRAARSLVMRALWMIWCPVIAVLTLYDWVV